MILIVTIMKSIPTALYFLSNILIMCTTILYVYVIFMTTIFQEKHGILILDVLTLLNDEKTIVR